MSRKYFCDIVLPLVVLLSIFMGSCTQLPNWIPPPILIFSVQTDNNNTLYFVVIRGTKQVQVYKNAQSTTLEGDIIIPASVVHDSVRYEVTTIGESAFDNCREITSVSIPASVKSIGDRAFRNCTGLVSINIPDSIIYIGLYSFYKCTGLRSVTLSHNIAFIDNVAFFGCSALTSVEIPKNIRIIGGGAFNSSGVREAHMKSIAPPDYAGKAGPFPPGTILYVPTAGKRYYSKKTPWDSYTQILE